MKLSEYSQESYSKKKTDYIKKINNLLKPKIDNRLPTVTDLFAGCGGLSLGFEAHGFLSKGWEKNKDACSSYNQNLIGDCSEVNLCLETQLPKCQILIGGPPCQPFSVNGKQKGMKDERDGFPIFISLIEKNLPDLILIENVRGLMYRNKKYLDDFISIVRGFDYLVEVELLNAVNYETPQNRERVFIVGHRGQFSFPHQLSYQISAGEALEEMAYEIPHGAKFLTENMNHYIAKYEKASKCQNPRDLHLHKSARTLTCRNLAGATGDMQRIKLPDGRRRRLTIREAARLQSFPDWFIFSGSEQSVFYQIGNAVPPMLSYHLAESCKNYIQSDFRYSLPEIRQKNSILQMSIGYQQLQLF
jgi:DNA (cytosine-5)-methyltransferase 1